MFDIGWQELFIVAVLIVIVVGPKDLPRTLRAIMGWVRKARVLAREFQDGVDDVVRQADLEDIKNQVTSVGDLELGKEFKDGLGLSDDVDVDAIKSDVKDVLSLEPPRAASMPVRAKKTTVGAAKTPRRARKGSAKKKPASPVKGRTGKKGTPSPAKAAKAARPKKAATRPDKAAKAARPKKAAARRPSRGARAPAKKGA